MKTADQMIREAFAQAIDHEHTNAIEFAAMCKRIAAEEATKRSIESAKRDFGGSK